MSVYKVIPRAFTRFGGIEIFTNFMKMLRYEKEAYSSLGLLHHDLLAPQDPVIMEARRRLPQEVLDEYNWRCYRAHLLTMRYSVLPENERLDYDEHEKIGYYLTPYLEEVHQEIAEKMEWESRC